MKEKSWGKKGCFFVLSFLLAVISFWKIATYADEANNLRIDDVVIENEQIKLYVNMPFEQEFVPTKDVCRLVVDDQDVIISNIERYEQTQEGTSYLFIIDVSGSMDQKRIDDVKVMIGQFVSDKRINDKFCICQMGNEISSSGLLTNEEEISAYLDGVNVTREDTNLYQSICEELDYLLVAPDINHQKCMVIFSDGAEDQATGITREEAIDKVKQSNIPIFTVAMLKQSPSEEQIENAKILGSFARSSSGGKHYAPVVEQMNNENVYPNIKQLLNNNIVITGDISEVYTNKEQIQMTLVISDEINHGQAQQMLNGALFFNGNAEKTGKAVSESTEEVLEVENDVSERGKGDASQENSLIDDKNNMLLVVGIGGTIVIIIIIFIFLRFLQKKSVQGVQDRKNKVNVTLYRLGENTKEINFSLKTGVLIGRGKMCHVKVPEDVALSEVHCIISQKDGAIIITDEKSTNGTYVNGIPVMGEIELNKNDVLLIGSYEYQIVWQ